MEINVTGASLDDVVGVLFDGMGEQASEVTLGDVVVDALLEKLTGDPRWGDLAQRFADAAEQYLAVQAPGFVEALVAAEVTRQLTVLSKTAAVRGEPSTVAEAIIATEVTTQLRAQFAPIVQRAMDGLAQDLAAARTAALAAFRKGTGA